MSIFTLVPLSVVGAVIDTLLGLALVTLSWIEVTCSWVVWVDPPSVAGAAVPHLCAAGIPQQYEAETNR